jgi:DNA replication protein DnaC
MLNEQTMSQLSRMLLSSMAKAFKQQIETPGMSELSFEERFGMLVDAEWTARHNNQIRHLVKSSGMKSNACVEDIDWALERNLDRQLILQLANCTWISQGLNAIVTGPTGTGKTWLSCALGTGACRNGCTTLYIRVPRLLTNLVLSRGDGSYNKLMRDLTKTSLLILDDWGLSPLNAVESRDLLEVIEDRCQLHSTLVTSQLPVSAWHALFEEPTVADAIMDRLIHDAYRIELKGDTMRRNRSKIREVEAAGETAHAPS